MSDIERDRIRFRHRALRVIEGLLAAKIGNLTGDADSVATLPVNFFQNISLELLYADEDEWWVFNPSETTPDVLWPIDVCMISHNEERADDRFDFDLTHIVSVSPKQARGKARLFSKYMIQGTAMGLNGDLNSLHSEFGGVRYYSSFLGKRWVTSSGTRYLWEGTGDNPRPIPRYQRAQEEFDKSGPSLCIGVALRHRYEWAVSIGYEESPSVRVAIDPTAVKELFKFREVPSGARRREALLRWVDEHWRQNRTDPEIENYVRKHLRGGTRFNWEGLDVTIMIPDFDIEQDERLIRERLAMREHGSDRRQRLRP